MNQQFPMRYLQRISTILCLALTLSSLSLAQTSPDVSGQWHGTLTAGQFEPLEVIFHIQGQPDAWTATLDIPTHSRFGLTADSVSVRNGNLMIRVNSLQVEYYGSLLLDGETVIAIDGDWGQSGEHVPLKLTAVKAD